ncbi:MAG: 50S ribosomal protein L23 [Candidatus Wallbacteria bacterium]|nr:50S ribosomal protein L23 [Candidatus Wallbacteria bacterium]
MKKNPRDVILAPMVSEKSVQAMEENQYTFKVSPDANKIDVRRAVEELFKVHVVAVKTQNYLGKPKRLGKYEGKRSDYKKAIVKLKDGETIPVFEGV